MLEPDCLPVISGPRAGECLIERKIITKNRKLQIGFEFFNARVAKFLLILQMAPCYHDFDRDLK